MSSAGYLVAGSLIATMVFLFKNMLKLYNTALNHEGLPMDQLEERLAQIRLPLSLSCVGLIVFAANCFPDTIKLRPFPAFWRGLLGVLLCYASFMTLVLALPANEARTIFKLFDSNLGKPLDERSYADDCRVYTPENPESNFLNIKEAVFDVHFVAHLAGWWFKMLIIRDYYCAWIISASFELVEISLRHMLPNFWECWWDHVSYLILLTNSAFA